MAHGGDRYRNRIRLDFSVNLNPLGSPEPFRKAMEQGLRDAAFYPDPMQEKGRRAAAAFYGMRLGCEISPDTIIPGNGASELIMALFHGLCPRRVLLSAPCFTGYLRAAEGKCAVDVCPAAEKDGFQAKEPLASMIRHDTDLVILISPGNPGGRLVDHSFLKKLLAFTEERRIPVLIDECFHGFTGRDEESGIRLLADHPHLMVLRAFTKIFALPGLRLGLLFIGNGELRKKITASLPEWNLSSFADAVLRTAGDRKEELGVFLDDTVRMVKELRDKMTAALRKEEIRVFPSDTAFLLTHGIGNLSEPLLRRGILTRSCEDMLPGGYVRLAVRPEAEQIRLLEEIKIIRREQRLLTGV